ncbi:MAG: helix-turn-helix transcriptional regulator [Rhodobacter sp.]|nr:helix-turn-helix transcriptional regulator [Rhodobacter sp.]
MEPLPNAAEGRLAEAIRRMGQAGFETALTGWLRRSVPCDNLIMLAYRDAAPPLVLYHQADDPKVYGQLDSTYLAGAYLLDPYHDLHQSRVAAGLYRMRDIAPDQFQRSRYFLDYYRNTGLIDEVTFVAYPAPGVTLNICLGRDGTSGQVFSAAEVHRASRIAPIVTALSERHWSGLSGPTPGAGRGEQAAGLLRAALVRSHGIRLSPRQAEVALLILRGHSSVSIGLRLAVSPQTVKVFRRQLYARCAITTQAELFALLLPLLKSG